VKSVPCHLVRTRLVFANLVTYCKRFSAITSSINVLNEPWDAQRKYPWHMQGFSSVCMVDLYCRVELCAIINNTV